MVTDDERIQEIERNIVPMCGCLVCEGYRFLLQQLEQRDKTIVELQRDVSSYRHGSEIYRWKYLSACEELNDSRHKNKLMLSALEHYACNKGWTGDLARDTIAQVKANTASM